MMQSLITKSLFSAAIITVLMPFVHAQEKIKHYDVEKIENSQEALMVLNESEKKINNILNLPSLKSSHLEDIHHLSYQLEAAVEILEKEKQYDSEILQSLSASIENLHDTSEDHQQDKIQASFLTFQTSKKAFEKK